MRFVKSTEADIVAPERQAAAIRRQSRRRQPAIALHHGRLTLRPLLSTVSKNGDFVRRANAHNLEEMAQEADRLGAYLYPGYGFAVSSARSTNPPFHAAIEQAALNFGGEPCLDLLEDDARREHSLP
jgi:hypothetical protein